jgi:6-phosphogluconolactonase
LPTPDPHIYRNPDEFADEAVEAIGSFINQELKEQGTLRIVMGGGKSQIPIYKKLAENKKIPWSRVYLFLTDEGYVPLNSKDSNYGIITENLVDKVSNLRRFYHYNTRDEIKTIVDQYEKTLRAQESSPLFDLVVLGIGADGSIASLFPSDTVLHEEKRLVAHTQDLNHNAENRMTLTFPAILNSKKIICLTQGKDKQKTIDNLINGNQSIDQLPAKKILEHEDVEIFCNY